MADARVTLAQAYALARAAGFSPVEAVIMAAIGKAESGLRIAAHNDRGEDSRGIWQVNLRAHPWADPTLMLTDPLYQAKAAYRVYVDAGRRFTPWSVYKNGSYRQFIADASAAAGGVDTSQAQGGRGAPALPADFDLPGPVDDAARGLLGDVFDKLNPLGKLGDAVGAALTGAGRLMIQGMLLAGGVVLVVLGADRAVRATPVAKKAEKGVEAAAAAAAGGAL